MTAEPTTTDSTEHPDAGLHYDVVAAYLAAGARVASWVIVSAVVFRWSVADYAILGAVRYTIAILNYTSLGLAPAMIRLLAESRTARPGEGVDSRAVYSNALILAAFAAVLGVLLSAGFAAHWSLFLHSAPDPKLVANISDAIFMMGFGTVIRLAGDAPGALLQTRGRIGLDNIYLALGEAAWLILFLILGHEQQEYGLTMAAKTFAAAAFVPLVLRWFTAAWIGGMILPDWRVIRPSIIWFLLAAGGMVLLAQLADYLYAPIDYVLINRFLDPIADAAAYTPVAQIGSALLLVSSGLAAVLLPRSAVAHAEGNIVAVRRYYVRGTLASAAALAVVAAAIWLTLPMILRLWLGAELPQTIDVMPIMLLASVVGGSGMVGRSILIGTGKFGVFTASVLLAAVANVLISYLLVRYTGFGLAGVVFGTLAATMVRCVIWMPWYVLRMLRQAEKGKISSSAY